MRKLNLIAAVLLMASFALGSGYYGSGGSSSSSAATWGSITGTLSSQSDLNTQLTGKAASGANSDITSLALSGAITGVTSITASTSYLANSGNAVDIGSSGTGMRTGYFSTSLLPTVDNVTDLGTVNTMRFRSAYLSQGLSTGLIQSQNDVRAGSANVGYVRIGTSANAAYGGLWIATASNALGTALVSSNGSGVLFNTNSGQNLTFGNNFTSTWTIGASPYHFTPATNNASDFGSSSNGVRDVWIARTLTTGQYIDSQTTAGISIKGVTNGSNSPAGYVGQVSPTCQQTTANNFPTSTQFGDLCSVSLTAGDWDCWTTITSTLNGATGLTQIDSGFSVNTGDSSTGLNYYDGTKGESAALPVGGVAQTMTIGPARVSQSSTVLWYGKVSAVFAAGAPQYVGGVYCRRPR